MYHTLRREVVKTIHEDDGVEVTHEARKITPTVMTCEEIDQTMHVA